MNKSETKKSVNNFGRKGWAVVFYVLLIYLFTCVTNDTLNVTTGFFGNFLQVDPNSLLPFAAVGGFVGVILSLVAGIVIAKKNVKVPTAVLFTVLGLLFAFNGQAKNVGMFAIATILTTAVSQTLNLVCTQQIMSNWFPKKKGIALGWATMGMPICSAVMVAVFEGLFHVDISAPYWLMFAICVILAIVTGVWFKNYPEEAGAYPDNEPVDPEEQKKTLEFLANYKSPWTVGKLLKAKEFWMLVFIFGFMFMGLVATVAQLIPRINSLLPTPNNQMGIMWLTIASIIGIPGSFAWGFIDQKIGTGKTNRIFCVCWTVTMVLSFIGMQLRSLPLTIVTVVLYALLNGGLGNMMPSMFISIFGRYDFAQANKVGMPLIICLRSLTLIIMPIILAAAGADQAMGYRNVFVLISVLSVIATILAFLLKDKTIGTVKAD
ncbi:MAG: MFS transporter [Oscillospiraceae bacterium]|nr:MFS transporter [Oscillospiraceae bacterium]